jgi:hypothetical protein
VRVTRSNQSLKLDRTRDYIVELPDHPLVGPGGFAIQGGNDVVLIGGEIEVPWQGEDPPNNYGRGLYLLNQTGTVHVEGLYLHGDDLSEGIDLGQSLGAVVQLQNIRIEGIHARTVDPRTGVPLGTHPDLIQTWGGPRRLLVDGLTGTTDYQGFFLNPNELYSGPAPELMDFRNVDITGLEHSAYLLWKVGDWPLHTSNVWLQPRPGRGPAQTLWPNASTWSGVQTGTVTGGFVPAGVAGADYRSPGYGADGSGAAAARAGHTLNRARTRRACRRWRKRERARERRERAKSRRARRR